MKLSESNITANGINIHVYRTNTDKPPLVFAHGRSDNGLCYAPIAQHFAEDYEIILYDARSHGQSDNPTSPSTMMDRAEDLAGVIDALGLDNPTLIGHSLGAVTIELFAGSYPDIPKAIILEDPPTFEVMADNSEQALDRHKQWETFIGSMEGKSISELIKLGRQNTPTWSTEELGMWAIAKTQYRLKPFGEDRIDPALGNKLVSQITCPTLIITADLEKGSIYPPPKADTLASQLPNAKHVNIPDAGHNIRREQPEAFLVAVRNFLT